MRSEYEMREKLAELVSEVVSLSGRGDGHHSALSHPILARMHDIRTLEFALEMDEHVSERIEGYDTDVDYVEMETGEPQSPPDRYDGMETQEIAASVGATCDRCSESGYLLGEHPGMFLDEDEFTIRCPECMPDESLIEEILEKYEGGMEAEEIIDVLQAIEDRYDVEEEEYLR